MDSGQVAEGESLEHDYNILQSLTPPDVLGIMDELLSFEVSAIKAYMVTSAQIFPS